MPRTTQTQTQQTTTTVAVRVPHGADGDLTAEARQRLASPAGVSDVAVEGLRDISPGLSATAVTARVTIELAAGTDLSVLTEAPFVTVRSE